MTLLPSRLGLTYQQARHQSCPAAGKGDETHPGLKAKDAAVSLSRTVPTTFSSPFFIR